MSIKRWIVTLAAMAMAVVAAGCGAANTNATDAAPAEGNTKDASAMVQTIPGGLQGKKVLVAYYSWSGHTKAVAEQIQQETGADIVELQPAKPYPTDYQECVQLAKEEMNNNARPAVATKVDNMDEYDVVFVGYPIWWGKAPMFVYTFLEGYNFDGKTIVPFCTSGGSPIDGSLPDIQTAAKGATIVEGIESTNPSAISQWLKQIQAVQ